MRKSFLNYLNLSHAERNSSQSCFSPDESSIFVFRLFFKFYLKKEIQTIKSQINKKTNFRAQLDDINKDY